MSRMSSATEGRRGPAALAMKRSEMGGRGSGKALYVSRIIVCIVGLTAFVSLMFASSVDQPAKPEVGQRVRVLDENGHEQIGKVLRKNASTGSQAQAVPRLSSQAQQRMRLAERADSRASASDETGEYSDRSDRSDSQRGRVSQGGLSSARSGG